MKLRALITLFSTFVFRRVQLRHFVNVICVLLLVTVIFSLIMVNLDRRLSNYDAELVENVKETQSQFDVVARFNMKKISYPSKKAECNVYRQEYHLYPSLFGFRTCQLYEFEASAELPANRGIACESSGDVSTAVFTKNAKGEQLECFFHRNSSKFQCIPRTDAYAVCGCTMECDSDTNSVLSNLPITYFKSSRKVISFSVYGSNTYYTCGILRQVRLAKIFFPDWSSHVYVNSSVPKVIVDILRREAEVIEIHDNSPFANSGMFWRFMVADDNDVDVYCIRDGDSVFTHREASAINYWLESGKGFNSMKDHSYHSKSIMGGMWCGRKRIKKINYLMLKWSRRDKIDDDQQFLNAVIWPRIKDDLLVFDTCKLRRSRTDAIPFPSERIGCEFIGFAHRDKCYLSDYYNFLCYDDLNPFSILSMFA